MIRIAQAEELVDSFRDLDRDQVELPDTFAFPMLLKDYLVWVEPSGHRVFLVFAHPERRVPMGLVFQRGGQSDSPPMMCEFCHNVRSGGQITMMTAAASRTRRVGLHLCRDLGCKHGEDPALARERAREVTRRMAHFARQNLF